MLKAVIFDMDGVLIDSEPLHAKAAVLLLKEYGIDINIEYCYGFIGSTAKKMFQTAITDFNLEASIDEMLERNAVIIAKLHEEDGFIPIEGTKELIIDLKENGMKLAVASSSSLNLIKEVTSELGIIDYFDKLVSGADVKHPKPAPDVFQKAMSELNVLPDECIIIEDSMNGVLAAFAANVKSIGFINPNSGHQDLSKASVLIESFKDITYDFILNEYKRAYGIPITIATTDRLIIRELTVEDITNMYHIYQNPEVKKYIDNLDDYLEIEIEKHKAYIKNVYEFFGYGLWGVFNRENGELIGRCGIQNREIDGKVEIEIGYLLDQKHWGLGYAMECTRAVLLYTFEYLGINRVVAQIHKMNTRSINLAKRMGFHLEKEFLIGKREYYLYVIDRKEDINLEELNLDEIE
jgi:beta-phosphoglucomutase-like phosphatase (HAD superfamily)/RimJ/RimL family protein N-acetyltransferase